MVIVYITEQHSLTSSACLHLHNYSNRLPGARIDHHLIFYSIFHYASEPSLTHNVLIMIHSFLSKAIVVAVWACPGLVAARALSPPPEPRAAAGYALETVYQFPAQHWIENMVCLPSSAHTNIYPIVTRPPLSAIQHKPITHHAPNVRSLTKPRQYAPPTKSLPPMPANTLSTSSIQTALFRRRPRSPCFSSRTTPS